MAIDLIIRSNPAAIDFALLKDGILTELHREKTETKFNVGDIFMGKVSKIMPGLNATFVHLRTKKDGFLHYHDLGPNVRSLLKYVKQLRSNQKKNDYLLKHFKFEAPIKKDGSITQVLHQGRIIPVQIVKEPISTKGPRLTSELSLAGRYLVLVPFTDNVFVSTKIDDKQERQRLLRLAESIRPKHFGLIVRTAAEGIKVAELHKDLQNLIERWKHISAQFKTVKPGYRVYGEAGKAVLLLRDLLNDQFRSIVVDEKELYLQVKEIVRDLDPDKEKIVKFYSGSLPVFEHYGIEKQIKTGFGKTVGMKNGAYLIIEHTEAMHVIDVNSGNISSDAGNQEETALKVNLEAAKEIARQLRLRDMGGLIIVDFIDMRKQENKRKLYEFLKDQMKDDRAKHKILPPSKFGLIQITRQRVRPENKIDTTEADPGKVFEGKVEAPITLISHLENRLNEIMKNTKGRIILAVHPFVAAYLKKGLPSWQWRKIWQYKRWLTVQPRHGFRYLEYKFFDRDGNEVEL